METGAELIRVTRKELRQHHDRIRVCLEQLSAEQIWHRDSEVENSVGNLVLHLCGNLRQWIVSGIGGADDIRDRDWEFTTRDPLSPADLLERLENAVKAADVALAALSPDRLLEARRIQVFDVTVVHALVHVATHFAGHAGQIIWATKRFTRKDLGFYAHLRDGGSTAGGTLSP